ncbi:hypothetical protein L1887_63333 [Cichorium endivia]|nr:hypothetical protein L1887_63333 [Cichorium endivia]
MARRSAPCSWSSRFLSFWCTRIGNGSVSSSVEMLRQFEGVGVVRLDALDEQAIVGRAAALNGRRLTGQIAAFTLFVRPQEQISRFAVDQHRIYIGGRACIDRRTKLHSNADHHHGGIVVRDLQSEAVRLCTGHIGGLTEQAVLQLGRVVDLQQVVTANSTSMICWVDSKKSIGNTTSRPLPVSLISSFLLDFLISWTWSRRSSLDPADR